MEQILDRKGFSFWDRVIIILSTLGLKKGLLDVQQTAFISNGDRPCSNPRLKAF